MAKRKKKDAACELVAYRFYGVPSERDAVQEDKTFGCCRYLWNRMLGDHNTLYAEIGHVPNNTPADYKDLDECLFLNEVDSLALANTALNLDAAFDRFFKKTGGYPRFKAKKRAKRSYTTNAVYGSYKGRPRCNIHFNTSNGLLQLPKHRDPVQLKLHRPIKPGGKLKSVTITQEPDGKRYYSILMEYLKPQAATQPVIQNGIGLDYSMPNLYVDSNGASPVFPKPYRTMEPKLARAQKKLSRKKPGPKRYEKQRMKVAKLYAKSKHQRKDVLHKLSCTLTDTYDLIAIEDLDMSAMKQALRFGKAVSDNGWGMFVSMLTYKAERKGKLLVKVDRWFPSSKTCIACGHIHKELKLSDRTYLCPVCGHAMDRDEQAAKNILNEAKRMAGAA